MNDSFDLLIADGLIDEVLGRLKSGKEAEVWLVRHEGAVVAAKLYKDRTTRSFKNNAGYLEGRRVRNTRTQRAMEKGSRFGRQAAEEAWKEAEANALYRLHAAGVRVPTPLMFYEGILLMELVTGADGNPAPRLIDVPFTPSEAAAAYADLRAQMVAMLCCDLIHGDLSPYNVLWGAKGPTIIDLPQHVDAAANNRSFFYFQRDLENLRRFFASFDRGLHRRRGDAREIWRAYEKRELTPDFVPEEKAVPEPQAGPRREGAPPAEERRPREPQRGGRGNGREGRDEAAFFQPAPRREGAEARGAGQRRPFGGDEGREGKDRRGGRPNGGERRQGSWAPQERRGAPRDAAAGVEERPPQRARGSRRRQQPEGPVVERVRRLVGGP